MSKSIVFRSLAFLLLLTFYISAQNPAFTYVLHPDSSSINQILKYNLNTQVQNDIEIVQKNLSMKSYFEFHIGCGTIFDQSGNNQNVPLLGIKFSPYNSKLSLRNEIKARLFRIRQYARFLGDSLSKADQDAVDAVERSLNEYDHDKWLRLSVGLVFPYTLYNWHLDTLQLTPLTTTTSSYWDPYFMVDKISAFVGYDIADYLTVSIGATIQKNPLFYAGLSVDISTPIYAGMSSFLNNLRTFTGNRVNGNSPTSILN